MKRDERHVARQAALQILYQWEIGRTEVAQAADTFFTFQWPETEPPSEWVREFASGLARETVDRLDAIDPLIAETSERWRPERMAVVDRLILRLAVCELLRQTVPPAVVINEAIELGRRFSADDSAKFISGMLDAIRKKIGPS